MANTLSPFRIKHELDVLGTGTSSFAGTVSAIQYLAGDGDSNDAAYTFASDPNTGMYLPASGELGFTTNGNARLTFSAPASGVGSGGTNFTHSPVNIGQNSKLHAFGSNLVTNGTFTGNATGWTLGTGWAYGTNNAVCTLNGSQGTISQSITVATTGTLLITIALRGSAVVPTGAILSVGLTGYATQAIKYSRDGQERVYKILFHGVSTGVKTLSFTGSGSSGTLTVDAISALSYTALNGHSFSISDIGGDTSFYFKPGYFDSYNYIFNESAVDFIDNAYNVVAMGLGAVYSLVDGNDIVAIGSGSASTMTTGSHVIAIGGAFNSAQRAGYSIGIGQGALSICHGDRNIGIGNGAGGAVGSGTNNIFLGSDIGVNADEHISNNVIIGHYAASDNVVGHSNTLIGNSAGFGISGNNNTGLGFQCFEDGVFSSGNYNLCLGSGTSVANGNNQLSIQNIIYGWANSGTGSTVSTGRIAIGTNTDDGVSRLNVLGQTKSTTFLPTDAATTRANFGLGTMSTQAATAVNIDGGAIDGTTIGATTPAAGTFTRATATAGVVVGGPYGVGSASSPGIISYEYPTTRHYIGDGSGYSWALASRTGGVTTDIVTVVDSSKNVGIGTTSPFEKLDVASSGATRIKISSSDNTQFRGVSFGVNGAGSEYGSVAMHINSGEIRYIAGYAGWGGFHTLYTDGSERMRIHASGNVSIGNTTNSEKLLVTGGIKSNHATNGIGYATGAGGTVTQATNKSTGVTLNKACGEITMNGAALAANTNVSFTLTNSAIAATDVLVLNHASGGTGGAYMVDASCNSGTATIRVRNLTAGSLSEAIKIRFAVIKGVTS